MSNKADKIYQLFPLIGQRESIPIDFDNFKRSMLFLSDSILDSKLGDYGPELVEDFKAQSRDPNIPYTHTFAQVYADNFNSKIMVIQVDKDYKFKAISGEFNPDTPNEMTDHLVMIQKENIHFGLVVPHKNLNKYSSQIVKNELDFLRNLRMELFHYFINKFGK